MGQKTNPIGFRLGISKDWRSKYYAGRELPKLLKEDELLRKYLKARLGHAAISDIVIAVVTRVYAPRRSGTPLPHGRTQSR